MRSRTFARAPLVTFVCLLFLAGCPAPERADEPPPAEPPPAPELAPLEVSDSEIRAADGSVLLQIDDVPTNIPVDEDTEFGAATRFTAASAAPDEQWFAVVTVGAAHSGGWLVRVESRAPHPATFQYGGNVSIGPWSEDGRYVVFVEEGPAPSRTLSLVDRQELGATVTESSAPVHAPGYEDRPADEIAYEPVEWRDGRLVFAVDGERYHFDPATGAAEPDQ